MNNSKKKKLGQFYTKNVDYICQDLLDIFPPNATVIDMFAGNWDLLNSLDPTFFNIIGYDICPQEHTSSIQQDTLLNPIHHSSDFYVYTNPPYLYQRNNEDKMYYEKYHVNDLYKASILSIIESNPLGGILIIPLNFLSGLDHAFRKIFFKHFTIIHCNIFHEQVFSDTTTTVIAFKFIKKLKKQNLMEESLSITLFPEKISFLTILYEKFGYQIGGEVRYKLSKNQITIGRLMEGDPIPNSLLFLRAIDSSNMTDLIHLSLNESRYFGKETSRTFATIVMDKSFSISQQRQIADLFNQKIKIFREKYHGLFLTNFREKNRKRIGFKFAYELISSCIAELEFNQRQITSFF